MDKLTSLNICSYNCRSLKSAVHDVLQLCETHDVVCLQEHWLLPSELGILSDLHKDFFGFGYSAVDVPYTLISWLVGHMVGLLYCIERALHLV